MQNNQKNVSNSVIDGSASWLRQFYIERRRKNPSYSLRAFARHLDVPAPRLCDIFNGKRLLTSGMARVIAERLELKPKQKQALLECISRERSGQLGRKNQNRDAGFSALQSDIFESVAAWYHFAILELTRTNDFQWDYRWMAKRLGITSVEAGDAVERLLRLGLLEENRGKLSLPRSFTTTHDIPSSALRLSHRQSIEMAIASLADVPVDLRDITSITAAIDVEKIGAAKELIKKFRRQLSKFLEKGKRTEVYNINIQLVPVTKRSVK